MVFSKLFTEKVIITIYTTIDYFFMTARIWVREILKGSFIFTSLCHFLLNILPYRYNFVYFNSRRVRKWVYIKSRAP